MRIFGQTAVNMIDNEMLFCLKKSAFYNARRRRINICFLICNRKTHLKSITYILGINSWEFIMIELNG